jgi:hypothetical protein
MEAILQERNGERARESEEKIGQHGVAMKFIKKRRGELSFKGGRGERPPLHVSKWHSCKRGGPLRGRTKRERGTPHERGKGC